jgi:hypothetical protein
MNRSTVRRAQFRRALRGRVFASYGIISFKAEPYRTRFGVPRRNSVSAFFVPPRRYQFYYGSRPFSRILTNKPERNLGDMTHKELLTKYRAKYGAASLKDLKTRARKASDSGNTGTKQTRSNQPTAHGSAADTVPFGKYRGEKLETLLSDENYLEWILAQPGMVEQWKRRNPAFGRLLAEAIGGGALVRQSRVQFQKLAQEIGEIYKEAREIDVLLKKPPGVIRIFGLVYK